MEFDVETWLTIQNIYMGIGEVGTHIWQVSLHNNNSNNMDR